MIYIIYISFSISFFYHIYVARACIIVSAGYFYIYVFLSKFVSGLSCVVPVCAYVRMRVRVRTRAREPDEIVMPEQNSNIVSFAGFKRFESDCLLSPLMTHLRHFDRLVVRF